MTELARVGVAALLNSVWEAALLAVVVGLVLRLLPNLNATTRYAAWCIALLSSLILPIATAIPQVTVQAKISPARTAAATVATTARAARASTARIGPVDKAVFVPQHSHAAASPQTATATPSVRLPERLRVSLPDIAATIVFAAWALATLLLLVRLGVNLTRLEQLKRDALPLPIDYRDKLAQWTRAEKGGREVRLCVTDGIMVPVAVGLFDSMILVPQHLLDELAPAEIDQIMLHELGHLRRADDWTNGLQRVVQALFFFNPAIVFIAQQLDLEREVACDDWVLRETQNVRPYAHCLTKMAEVTAWPHRPLAAPGVFVTRRGLSVRVERLLRAGRNVRTSLSLGAAGSIAAAAALICFFVQTVAPSYAFTQDQSVELPPPPQKIASTPKPPPKPKALKSTPKALQAPKAAQPPQTTRTIVREKYIYVERHSTSNGTTVAVPAQHIHVPAHTVRIPAIDVDVKQQRVHVPEPHVHVAMPHVTPPVAPDPMHVLPPNFNRDIEQQVQDSLRDSGVGGDFTGMNLGARDYHGKRLTGADFTRANLANSNFAGATLAGIDFSHANLSGVNFTGARMTGCDFTHSNVSGARFNGVELTGCDFSHASVDNGQGAWLLRGCRNGCDLSGLNLQNADLRSIRVSGTDLSGADLRGADLSNSIFTGVDFSHAVLDGARLNGASFINCSFDGVNMQHVDFSTARQIQHG